MHMANKRYSNSVELETIMIWRSPTTVMTANGEVQTNKEATVCVKLLDFSSKLRFFEQTPAVLSLGKRSEDHGCTEVADRYCRALGPWRKCACFPFFLVQPNGGGLCADQFCVHPLHVVTDSYDCVMAQEQNSSNPFIMFHQLGSGAHGTDPCSTPSSGDGTGSSERSSADGVQRIARSFRTGLSGSLVT